MKFKLMNLNEKEMEDLESGNGFIIDTDIEYKKLHKTDILLKNSIYSRKFSINDSDPDEVLTYLYTCDCEEITGQINEGKECPRCESKVIKRDPPVTKRGWIVLKPYRIMTYGGLTHLSKLLSRSDFEKFLKDKLKGVNVIDVYDYFPDFLERYGKKDKEHIKNFLLEHQEDIFTQYIPVISKKLRPMLKSHNIIKHFKMLGNINSLYTKISNDIQAVKEYNIRDNFNCTMTRSYIATIQRKYYDLCKEIETKVGGGKDKLLRDEIYATRLPFTARAVIVPLVTHKIDVCTIPYDVFRGIFREEILEILIEGGEPVHQAYEFVELNRALTEKDKRMLDEILENKLENPYILVNRQPTLKFQSTKSLEIVGLEDEDVLRIPSALLEGYNGDHLYKVA